MPIVPSLLDAPDIHLLFMAALILLAGLAGGCAVLLLLVMAPLAKLALDHARPARPLAAETASGRSGPEVGGAHEPTPLQRAPTPLN
ncbi:hypothetical protein IRJ34_01575 [Paenarthrobacter sp. GOM3]|uniref:hypothetical protein n=1 Tax=Paenarthrobacter sp. GOM3 TaxID=2782567 RepID=UPI001BA734D5|nr:hypothetical protein [Paenarthrobacter sp. GOM3]WOH19044.1 hypothetical protein IRJ34_01575 [Paenarthrobacter sp. GOM3]